MEPSLTPKQVAQAIGVSEASLKRWCDKGLLRAIRTAGGHRRLAIEDVLEFLRRTGRRPMSADLLQLPATRSATNLTIADSIRYFTDGLIAGDEELAHRVIIDLYLVNTSICDIGDRVIVEAMRLIGEKWSNHDVEPYQERRACEICGRVLNQLRSLLPALPESATLAIGATLSGDDYRIASLLVELALREVGWRAESLGTGLPAETLCSAIEMLRPRLFWLSVSYIASIPEFLNQYKLIVESARKFNVLVAVGGRALDSEVRLQMHYNAFCDSLRHVVNFVGGLSTDNKPTV